ncbi:MAG: glucuronyl hydrolase [Bacteroidota bacterium]
MQQAFYLIYLAAAILLLHGCSSTEKAPTDQEAVVAVDAEMLRHRLTTISAKAEQDASKLTFDSLAIPRSLLEDQSLDATKSKSWTSGFYPGTLWQLYRYSKNDALKAAAMTWQAPVEKEKHDSTTHDLGFKVFCPYGNAYRLTGNKTYQDIYVTAARTLSTRYNPNVGALRSWDHHADVWDFPVIVDNMMNLELLFEATISTGDSTFYYIAEQHATTTLNNHFRSDNSSYHVVDYHPDSGEVEQRHTHQGAFHESAWARGQAWGLYGFTVAYRYTRKPEFLAQAQKIAQYFFNHANLPEDLIPYWDFNAPNIPSEPRDVSAATIAASGLYELATYDAAKAEQYMTWADQILLSLEQQAYKTEAAPFFLAKSVGNAPAGSEIDVPIVYADYYYVEALLRRLELEEQADKTRLSLKF